MKKTSKAMRVACALAIATAMSTCVVAGTLAKYTQGNSGSDTASVAKWGVTVSAPGALFKSAYGVDDKTYTDGDTVVSSSTSDGKVIAPGTKGGNTGISITGSPEVAVKVDNSATVTLEGDWTSGSDSSSTYYCPLNVKVGGVAIENATSVQDLKQKIEEAVAKTSKTYAPNASSLAGAPSISWEWAFNGNDESDKALGNKTTAPKITISVSTTVTQID